MRRIAVLTSGGDAPGMNAAIRAVVRMGLDAGIEVIGVDSGYAGLIEGSYRSLTRRDVGGKMQLGGTMLGSARCLAFFEETGRRQAIDELERRGIEALVVIGGNGSQTGSHALAQMGYPVVGIASTIDNDLVGSDVTIGVDTAINVALEAIDRLRVTAESHGRAFLVETMGRNCGYVALMAGLAGGAEVISIPEYEITPEEVAAELRAAHERGKRHAMVVVAEGAKHNAQALIAHFEADREETGFSLRYSILGHVQRGAAPTGADRLLGSRLGAGAVQALLRGERGVLVGLHGATVATTPLADVVGRQKGVDRELLSLAHIMSL
ncbi:MAG: ATP-dependent 6-phosphofructokinase [Anaerolineae bacterium]|jgi:6-phosphofructokinase 1